MDIARFLELFPEFTGISDADFTRTNERVTCLFPEYNNQEVCTNEKVQSLLIAHFLVISGSASIVGIQKPSGVVGSSSVGSVSVGMIAPPMRNLAEYYFASTPYGLEYMAWINQRRGFFYVN